jgi:hypothetical protein
MLMSLKLVEDNSNYNYAGVVMSVTPEMAKSWLSVGASFQRNISDRRVREWLNLMNRGEWRLTHQGIAITKEGEVVDGQHRLHAVVRFGKSVEFVVTLNADPSIFDALDRGYTRSPVQILRLSGGEANARKIACLNTLLWTPSSIHSLSKVWTVGDITKMYSYFSDELDAVYPKNTPEFEGAYIRGAFLRVIISQPSLVDVIQRMLHVLCLGLPKNESEQAALLLRERLFLLKRKGGGRESRHQGYEKTIHAIRLFSEGKTIKYKGNLGREAQSDWVKLFPIFTDGASNYETFEQILSRTKHPLKS